MAYNEVFFAIGLIFRNWPIKSHRSAPAQAFRNKNSGRSLDIKSVCHVNALNRDAFMWVLYSYVQLHSYYYQHGLFSVYFSLYFPHDRSEGIAVLVLSAAR